MRIWKVASIAKKVGEIVEKTAQKVGNDIEKTAKKVGRDVETLAKKVGADIEKVANDAGGEIRTSLVGVTEKIVRVASKAERALDKICKQAGTADACEVSGSEAQFDAGVAMKRVSGVVTRFKTLGADFKAISRGDILLALNKFIDLAPVAFPGVLILKRLALLARFLKYGIPIFDGKDRSVKSNTKVDYVYTLAKNKGGPRSLTGTR